MCLKIYHMYGIIYVKIEVLDDVPNIKKIQWHFQDCL